MMSRAVAEAGGVLKNEAVWAVAVVAGAKRSPGGFLFLWHSLLSVKAVDCE
jgi:hypothetical protein